jgi:hypothetical protein
MLRRDTDPPFAAGHPITLHQPGKVTPITLGKSDRLPASADMVPVLDDFKTQPQDVVYEEDVGKSIKLHVGEGGREEPCR